MAVDGSIKHLLPAISYAQAEYSRQAGETIDDDSGAEARVRPSPDLDDLRGELEAVEEETKQLGWRVEEIREPRSERADELGRQIKDAGGHARIDGGRRGAL